MFQLMALMDTHDPSRKTEEEENTKNQNTMRTQQTQRPVSQSGEQAGSLPCQTAGVAYAQQVASQRHRQIKSTSIGRFVLRFVLWVG